MKITMTKKISLAAIVLFTFFNAACKKDKDNTPAPSPTPPTGAVLTGVKITSTTTLGNVITDNNGRSLYFFANDAGGTSNCSGNCTITWPVFYKANLSVDAGLNAADFGEITRTDGAKQITYKGWPLYYYASDATIGDVKGDAVGGAWMIAKADYTVMVGNAQLVGGDGKGYNAQGVEGTGASKYLTNDRGRTLYAYTPDRSNQNNWTLDGDAASTRNTTWPVYQSASIGSVPTIIANSALGTINVFGKTQVTFRGRPLYYFGADGAARTTKGVSAPTPGAGIWKVVNGDSETASQPADIKITANATLGNVITDNTGRSLYFFANDASGASACAGGCAVTWPAYYKANPSVGTGLNTADFGEITRTDGSKQTTYKGWPLYYFASDAAGDVKGDAVGSTWMVAKADYMVMLGNAQLVGADGVQYNESGVAGTGPSKYITDDRGRTLYLFSRDTADQNTYTNATLSNDGVWPMYQVSTLTSVPTLLTKGDFKLITVFGKSQLVFKGHPMYFFGQDTQRGSTKGVSIPNPGAGVWKIQNNSTLGI